MSADSALQFVRGLPPLTLGLAAAQTVAYVLTMFLYLISDGSSNYVFLALYPGLPMYFWTFVTAPLVSSSIFDFVLSVGFMVGCGRYLEQIWGPKQFAKFFVISTAISNLLALCTMIFISIVTQDISYLYELQISGLAGFISAVLVVFKQTLPEHQVHFFRSLISVRVKHLPVLYISTVTIGFLLKSMTVLDPTTMLLSVFGLLVSWAYLRFYQTQDGVRGDRSEAFAFTTFFPEQLHWIVKPLSNQIYALAVSFKLITASASLPVSVSSDSQFHSVEKNNTEVLETERRRAMALKALEERLKQQKPKDNSNSSSNSQEQPVVVQQTAAAVETEI